MARPTPDIVGEQGPEFVQKPIEDTPQAVGYCRNPECPVDSVQLFHPVGVMAADTAPVGNGQPHACNDMTHPHPAMCQCGHLLQGETVDA